MHDVKIRRVMQDVGDGTHHSGPQSQAGNHQLWLGGDGALYAVEDGLHQHLG